jgi:hypothetical protein
MTYRLVKLLTAVLCVGFLVGCGSGGPGEEGSRRILSDVPGDISGLGDSYGDISGTALEFPEGVVVHEDVRGVASGSNYDVRVGSGVGYVELLIVLHNFTNDDINVTFPAGLIIVSSTKNKQNGVLLKKVTVTVPANSYYRIALIMYCGNHHRGTSTYSEIYNQLIVSNSETLKELTDLLVNKKINIGEHGYNVSYLQGILWSLTDTGSPGLTQADKDNIATLPDN